MKIFLIGGVADVVAWGVPTLYPGQESVCMVLACSPAACLEYSGFLSHSKLF